MPISTPPSQKLELDALIIGGGVAGLWTLDALVNAGYNAALVESNALGAGQTICAQGILHGGVKYSLSGLLAPGARQVAEMPQRWEKGLSGELAPDLRAVTVRTHACHLWRTDSLKSILGMAGAKIALQVRPKQLAREARPEILKNCPGDVALLPEVVLETPSLLKELAALHEGRILHGEVTAGGAIGEDLRSPWININHGDGDLLIEARDIILCAGAGTPALQYLLGFKGSSLHPSMQRRPLHMAMVKGPDAVLPELNGHCVDGAATRVTVTSSSAEDGDRVWQLGGELAETGCTRDPAAQVDAARECLRSALPGFDVDADALRWATYTVDRAEYCENSTSSPPNRPHDAHVSRSARTVVVWPTKMVLAPRAAEKVLRYLDDGSGAGEPPFLGLPAPDVARPPWEVATWS